MFCHAVLILLRALVLKVENSFLVIISLYQSFSYVGRYWDWEFSCLGCKTLDSLCDFFFLLCCVWLSVQVYALAHTTFDLYEAGFTKCIQANGITSQIGQSSSTKLGKAWTLLFFIGFDDYVMKFCMFGIILGIFSFKNEWIKTCLTVIL